jgi:hypothetical protein
VAIRRQNERVIAGLPIRLPTGCETWLPDPAWPVESLRLPNAIRGAERGTSW